MSGDDDADDPSETWRVMAKALRRRGPTMPTLARATAQLNVTKAMRAAGVIDEDFTVLSVALAIEHIVDEWVMNESSPALTRISNQLREIERSYGLKKNEFWLAKDAPDEHRALSREWNRILDLLHFAAFEEYGEPEIAAMYRYNRQKYDSMRERGRRAVFGDRPKRS